MYRATARSPPTEDGKIDSLLALILPLDGQAQDCRKTHDFAPVPPSMAGSTDPSPTMYCLLMLPNIAIMADHYHIVTGLAYVVASAIQLFRIRHQREVIHAGGPRYARLLAAALLEGSNRQFKELFRMDKPAFVALVSWLQENGGLRGNRYQTAELKVMIVLWILAHGGTQRNAAHLFQVTQSSVARTMRTVLPILVSLHRHVVRLPDDDWLDPAIELNPQLNAFNGCIGAIDGTHVPAHVDLYDQPRWRDRKGGVSQNVFAAVRSDYSFSYVLAGAEGFINDASLCAQAFGRSFRVPENRFYVADAGFGVRTGIVIPFPYVRYHLQDWRDTQNPPETEKELYNLRHAGIRVVVEQAFGIVKRKWKIIRNAPVEYSMIRQIQIVYAVTGLHNFLLQRVEKDILSPEQRQALSLAAERATRTVGIRHPDWIRYTTAITLFEQYNKYRMGER